MTKRRKRHSPEEIVRKLHKADKLAAEGSTGEEIARALGVSSQTYYNWRSRYGNMDLNEAKELQALRRDDLRFPPVANPSRPDSRNRVFQL